MLAEKSARHLELGEFVPQKLPHYHRRGSFVYFMISRRPALELSQHEIALFDSIDGNRNVAELEKVCPGATGPLKHWHDATVVELIPPMKSSAGPHLVVVEPHMDDAVLWAGGRLFHRRGKNRITILSVVKWSNFTSYMTRNQGGFSVEDITALRLKEAALVARVLGAEHHCLEWSDSLLRVVPPNRWTETIYESCERNPQAFVKFFPDAAEVLLLAEQLRGVMARLKPDELWIPMGLEEHVDHRTTRSACLRMLAQSPEMFKEVTVDMYEDFPDAGTRSVGQDQRIRQALAACGTRTVPMREEIGDVFAEKVRVASSYASQYKQSYMEPILRAIAMHEASEGGRLAEAFHRLDGWVAAPRESDMCREAPGLASLRTRAARWLAADRRPRRFTVIALPSGCSGRWGLDTEFLLSTFPNIDLRFYVAGNCAWQNWDDGVHFKVLRGYRWLGTAVFEFFRFGCPLLVLWSGAYGAGLQKRFRVATAIAVRSVHALMRCLFPFREVLFAKSLSELCGVLAENMERDYFVRPAMVSTAAEVSTVPPHSAHGPKSPPL